MLSNIVKGEDCTNLFRTAYENRYTWEPNFLGYEGRCLWTDGEREILGTFHIGQDLKATVSNVDEEEILKEIETLI